MLKLDNNLNNYNNPKYVNKYNVISNTVVFIEAFLWLSDKHDIRNILYYTKHIFLSYKIYRLMNNTFKSYKNLKSICLPYKLKSIYSDCFKNCISLKDIYLPKNINYLGDNIFANCIKINHINIPSLVNDLKDNIILNCINLKTIKLPYSAKKYVNENKFSICGKKSIKNKKKNKNKKNLIKNIIKYEYF